MMALTPYLEDLPVFADIDKTDSKSLENNVVEPELADKNFGWHDSERIPERNVFNWLHRFTYRTLKWLRDVFFVEVDTNLTTLNNKFETGVLNMRLENNPGFGTGVFTSVSIGASGALSAGGINFTADYEIVGSILYIKLRNGGVHGVLDDTAALKLTLLDASFPASFVWTEAYWTGCIGFNGDENIPMKLKVLVPANKKIELSPQLINSQGSDKNDMGQAADENVFAAGTCGIASGVLVLKKLD
jgi:hypothetical protein